MAEGPRVEGFEITVRGLQTPVGLEIAALRVIGDQASFRFEPFSFDLPQPAEFEALIHAPTLAGFVKTRLPENFENATLTLQPGRIVVRATVRVILPVSATAVCTLRIEDGVRVFVQLESVEMLGAGVKGLVQRQIDAINPILDVSNWPADVEIGEIQIEEERLVAKGTLRPHRT